MSESKGKGVMALARVRCGQGEVLEWIFALATLSALVLTLAGMSQAQGQAVAPKSAAGATTSAQVKVQDNVTVTQGAGAKPTAQAAEPSAAGATAKSPSEGIKIHGHWTIEVRNPDGSVDKHVEFDNALVTTNLADMPGGPAFLYALLSGVGSFGNIINNNTSGTGGWAINLQAPTGTTPPSSPPCAFASSSINGGSIGSLSRVYFDSQIDSSLTPSCFVTSVPNYCLATGGGTATDCNEGLQVSMGSVTLPLTSISIPGYAPFAQYPTPTSFTLSGTVTASQSGGTIGSVQAIVFLVIPITISIPGTGDVFNESFPAPFLFTSHPITAVGPITQGQQIAANVSFTFN